MNSMNAFIIGEANRGKKLMVFDWVKAAKEIKKRGVKEASAGLRSDWEYTGGCIFKNGKPYKDDYTFLASTWAIPELEIDGEVIECYVMKSEKPKWDSDTKWPKDALKIFKKGV